MNKYLLLIGTALLLQACGASASYPAFRFTTMGYEEFSSYSQKIEAGSGYSSAAEMTYRNPLKEGETAYLGPKISFFWGTNGQLVALKKADGLITYSFHVVLMYQSSKLRRYDSVTDMVGNKYEFDVKFAEETNGGYMTEKIITTITEEQLRDAKMDGLFLTFRAERHEESGSNNDYMSAIGAALSMTDNLNNQASRQRQNDNYELLISKEYISNFMSSVK